MLKKLLRIKHWQLFLLLFLPVILFQIVLAASIGTRVGHEISGIFYLIPTVALFLIAIQFGWLYGIIMVLKAKLPESVKLPYTRIKFFLFVTAFYIFLVFTFIAYTFLGNNLGMLPRGIIGMIIPLHLLSMFGIFHTIYFAGKTIKCVETQQNESFGGFAGEFFLIWFNIIGIWILQPRLNKMVNNRTEYSEESDILDEEIF